MRLGVYLALGALLWFFVLKSGVHATLAGVALALAIPLRPGPGEPKAGESTLLRLEHALQSWVAFVVVPIFGFANAGVSLVGMSPTAVLAPVPSGISLGLFAGKQIGVFGATWFAISVKGNPLLKRLRYSAVCENKEARPLWDPRGSRRSL